MNGGEDVEICAPVERRLVRPRRRSSRRAATFRERPLFFEYMAVEWFDRWYCLFDFPEVIFVLMTVEGRPYVVPRGWLLGLAGPDKTFDWEGAVVEFCSGPFIGQKGVFHGGKVEITLLGKKHKVKAPTHTLKAVWE